MHFLIQVSQSENHTRHGSSFIKSKMKKNVRESFYTVISSGYVRVAVACLFFSFSIIYYTKTENWSVLDSILFVVVSASTVGYGNIHPTNTNSQIYTIFLMIFGTFVVYSNLMAHLHSGIIRLNKFLTESVTSRLKRTELLFQRRLLLTFMWVFACAVIGAVIIQAIEEISFVDALYFVVQTMMTVGYGDVAFHHQSTKIFLIFFIILSTAVLGLAINNIYAVILNRKVLNERRSLLKLQRRLHFLADLNDGRGVGRFEFVLTILEHIGTLDHDKDIALWLKKFEQLDTYESGFLNQQQLVLFSEQHAQQCKTEIEEIEQIALSTSNVEALPIASPSLLSRPLSVINDFRQRAGLFSDQELYTAENFDPAEGAAHRDAIDNYTDCAVMAENVQEQERFYSPSFRMNVVPSLLIGTYGRKYAGTPDRVSRTPTWKYSRGGCQEAKTVDGLCSTRSRRSLHSWDSCAMMGLTGSPACSPRYPVPQLHSAKRTEKALSDSVGKPLHLQPPLSTVTPCCGGADLTDDPHSPFPSLSTIAAMESGSYWDAELYPCPTPISPAPTVYDKEGGRESVVGSSKPVLTVSAPSQLSPLAPAPAHPQYYTLSPPSSHSHLRVFPISSRIVLAPSSAPVPTDTQLAPTPRPLVPSGHPPRHLNKAFAHHSLSKNSPYHSQDHARSLSQGYCSSSSSSSSSSSNSHSPTRKSMKI